MSLDRLKTDYIDMYLLHIPDDTINIEEVLTTLNELKHKKLIKTYGLCNSYSQFLESFLEHPLSQVEYIQDFYNIIERKAENLIFPYLKKDHKFMSYSPLYR
jgi:aryl-alcohol dehydrogenase-like predicted oxidoreductase